MILASAAINALLHHVPVERQASATGVTHAVICARARVSASLVELADAIATADSYPGGPARLQAAQIRTGTPFPDMTMVDTCRSLAEAWMTWTDLFAADCRRKATKREAEERARRRR